MQSELDKTLFDFSFLYLNEIISSADCKFTSYLIFI